MVTSLPITKSVLTAVEIKIRVYLYKVVIHVSLKLLRVADTALMFLLYFIVLHTYTQQGRKDMVISS